ncbi:unnamed protein product, partial [Candidula unifasciata]
MFNRLRKKKEDKPSASTGRNATSGLPANSSSTNGIDEAQGFLCPVCIQNFASAEAVQAHFEEQHGGQDGPVTEDQGEGFLCPMCKMSLASPEDLQSHYDTVHRDSSPMPVLPLVSNGEISGVAIQELRKELELLQIQLRGSEESRTLLASEMFHSEQKVTQLNLQLESLKSDKEKVESKAALLAGEIATMKAKVDESEGQRTALEDHIRTLK